MNIKPAWVSLVDTHMSDPDIYAFRALDAGTATFEQQRRCLDLIIDLLGGIRDLSFRPGDGREDAFHEGRRWVASQVERATQLDPILRAEALKKRGATR